MSPHHLSVHGPSIRALLSISHHPDPHPHPPCSLSSIGKKSMVQTSLPPSPNYSRPPPTVLLHSCRRPYMRSSRQFMLAAALCPVYTPIAGSCYAPHNFIPTDPTAVCLCHMPCPCRTSKASASVQHHALTPDIQSLGDNTSA